MPEIMPPQEIKYMKRGECYMTKVQAQIFEILQDIPDDKLVTAIEVLKGLRALSEINENEMEKETPDDAFGIFNKYANPDIIPMEKEAWGMAVKDKYDAH